MINTGQQLEFKSAKLRGEKQIFKEYRDFLGTIIG
jgi:hypothetical protein